MLQAPTRLCGLHIKSMVDIYREALICNTYRWLSNSDGRLPTILLGRVEDARLDFGIACDVDGTIFFDYRTRVIFLHVRPNQATQEVGLVRVSYDNLRPRLQFETGRTLVPQIYRACRLYKVRIDSEGDVDFFKEALD